MDEPEGDERGSLKIGAVARLTGVSVHTLRKWEDRYGAVEPRRTEGGERLYTRIDVERLRLIKRLSDAGLLLREVAGLSLEELSTAWEQMASTAGNGATERVRVAMLGSAVTTILARRTAGPGLLEVVAGANSLPDLAGALADSLVDVLVYECPTVRHDTERTVRQAVARVGARAAVVVYGFGSRADLLALDAPDIATLRAPADPAALEQAVARLVRPGVPPGAPARRPACAAGSDADVPPPRLSREIVARVANSAPRMRCECPRHLADIILSLRAFEQYSAECESLNPEDAALHHFLWRRAAQARAMFEEAIERVAEVEGISLEG